MQDQDIESLIAQTKQAYESIKSEIQSLDEKIKAKEKERMAIIEAPISKEDYLYFIGQEIKLSADKFKKGLAQRLGQQLRTLPSLMRNREQGNVRDYVYIPNQEGMFFYYCGELILEGINKVADEYFDWPDDAMPYTERMVLVGNLDTEINELNSRRDNLAGQLLKAFNEN